MKYTNPVVRGFYPDPSVCRSKDKYYLVCSSMQYFPGVPLFESEDLVNWTQIGHCLTRKSQIMLNKVNSSGGVFAPSIRYHEGRFYMVTTNDTLHQHFYVWTDDIYGDWSEPIYVNQSGIDPSFYFEEGKTYFMSNGQDDDGISGIVQCEINLETGEKLTKSKTIWQGTGGRYLEGPHLYKIGDYYYLVAAEGGTEYGHMVTYARGCSPYGPFENYKNNPVLTNRNLGGFPIQGVGHGDLIQDREGNYHMLLLGFRQTGRWTTFHHLGREVFLSPVIFDQDGWFQAGHNGTVEESDSICNGQDECGTQLVKKLYTFENTAWNKDWCYLRHPDEQNYTLGKDSLTLRGTAITLDEADSPTFIGLRQKEFNGDIHCLVKIDRGEAGITLYMDENHHYDLMIRRHGRNYEAALRLNVGTIKTIVKTINISESDHAVLTIHAESQEYRFGIKSGEREIELGRAQTRYLSSEVAGGFTGVMIGLYAVTKGNTAQFQGFTCEYE